jgi:hypothetical protein
MNAFQSDRELRLAGLLLVLLPCLVIASLVIEISSTSDADVFQRDEVAPLLRDINENEVTYYSALGFSIASNVIAVGVAAVLFVLLGDRSRLLATLGMVGILGGALAGFAADAGNITLGFLASDFADGGAGDIPAGDPAILETARSVGIASLAVLEVGWSALGVGLVALGVLIGWAPSSVYNPPRLLRWLAIVAGVCLVLTWLVALSDAAFIFVVVGILGIESFMLILGIWLLRQVSPDSLRHEIA